MVVGGAGVAVWGGVALVASGSEGSPRVRCLWMSGLGSGVMEGSWIESLVGSDLVIAFQVVDRRSCLTCRAF